MGKNLEVPSGARVIDAKDKFILPGMVIGNMTWNRCLNLSFDWGGGGGLMCPLFKNYFHRQNKEFLGASKGLV